LTDYISDIFYLNRKRTPALSLVNTATFFVHLPLGCTDLIHTDAEEISLDDSHHLVYYCNTHILPNFVCLSAEVPCLLGIAEDGTSFAIISATSIFWEN